jgi:hypothetical protein
VDIRFKASDVHVKVIVSVRRLARQSYDSQQTNTTDNRKEPSDAGVTSEITGISVLEILLIVGYVTNRVAKSFANLRLIVITTLIYKAFTRFRLKIVSYGLIGQHHDQFLLHFE